MLRKFLYLDEAALDGYISTLEDGLRVRMERSVESRREREAGLDVKVAKARGTGGASESQSTEMSDTGQARFERLLALAEADPESAGWVDLNQLSDLSDVGYGALVHAECEVFIPDAVQLLAGHGGAGDALDAMLELLPHAESLGLDTEGLPEAGEMRAMSSLLAKMSSDLVFVGEDESEWRVAGKLTEAHTRDGDIDGFVRVVGKVTTRWSENRWKPLLALPGASLVPRKERKALEAQRPTEEDEDSFLEGPAVMLDVLAMYR